jgi:tRNA G37 N-methylase Trm5
MISMQDKGAPVQLKVYYSKKGRQEGQQARQRIALLLQMDRLGMVRADIAALDGTLHVHFFVQDEATAQRFRKNIETVRRPLGADFDEVVVKVLVSRNKIAGFHDEEGHDETPGRIDLKA